MNRSARIVAALAAFVWFALPSSPAHPAAGISFDGWFFVFAGVWLLLFAVLPWRSAGAVRIWMAAWFLAVGLKAAAGFLTVPHGLTGTYEVLHGAPLHRLAKPTTPDQIAGHLDEAFERFRAPGRPWVRVDRSLQFADNSFTPGADSFHLTFTNYLPLQSASKPPLGVVPKPGDAHRHLDLCAVCVEWTGWIDVPAAGLTLAPDTDGWWSIAVAGKTVAAGGPGMPAASANLAAGLRQLRIRYLHPVQPHDAPRDRCGPRFVLDLPVERLHPGASRGMVHRDTAPAAEGLSLGALILGALLTLVGFALVVDWRAACRSVASPMESFGQRVPTVDRLALLGLTGLSFFFGFRAVAGEMRADANACTLSTYDYKIYLNRALVIARHGDPEPNTPRMKKPGGDAWDAFADPGADIAPARHSPPPASTDYHPFAPLNAWLRLLGETLEGRLGPTLYFPDEPATAENRLSQFHRGPLMDYWLAGQLTLFGDRIGLCYLFQVFVSAMGVWLVYGIGRYAFNRPVGLFAAAALALDREYVRVATAFYAEQPASVLVPAIVLVFLLARRRGGFGWPMLAGLLCAVAFQFRPNLALLVPVGALFLLWSNKSTLMRRAAQTAALGAVFALCWTWIPVRNQQLCGRPLWQPTFGPIVMIMGLDIPKDHDIEPYVDQVPGRSPAQVRRALEVVRRFCFDAGANPDRIGDPLPYEMYIELNPVLNRIVSDHLRDRPAAAMGMWGRRALRLWGWEQKRRALPYSLMMIAALGWMAWKGRRAASVMLVSMIVVISLPLIVFYFDDRHRVTFYPLVHVCFAAAACDLLRRTAIAICRRRSHLVFRTA